MKLFNYSISNGVLPLEWVSANVTPVFKKGYKHCISTYRPISLTCILCKVLERIIHRKLYSLLESHHVLSDPQLTLGFVQNDLIDGQFSNWCKVSSGVPQGFILGPLLFILCINVISSIVNTEVKFC